MNFAQASSYNTCNHPKRHKHKTRTMGFPVEKHWNGLVRQTGKTNFGAQNSRYDHQTALGTFLSPLCRCTATLSAAPTAMLPSTTPMMWSATTATARCHSAAICSATLSVAPTATLRSRMPTRWSATTKSAQCPNAAKRSARTTHAPTTTFRWMALRTSCVLPPGAPTNCAASSVSFAHRRRGFSMRHLKDRPDLYDNTSRFCARYRDTFRSTCCDM